MGRYFSHPVVIAVLLGFVLWGLNKSIEGQNWLFVAVHALLALLIGVLLWKKL